MTTVLVTGGLGFIGSHVSLELLNAGFNVIIIDNLSNSKLSILDKIEQLSKKTILFSEFDICDKKKLSELFDTNRIDLVVHVAGLKSVTDSIQNPIEYYNNNVSGTIGLLDVMCTHNCKKIIFSSSATVYGNQKYPVDEKCQTGINITNPYGKTKYVIEEILSDLYCSDNSWSIVILRYFNPVGADPSGLIGENPNGKPSNLFPIVLAVATGRYERLLIYGRDYNTSDGTCMRDYIHVTDLAEGHIASIKKLDKPGFNIYNLGTGKPTSVLEIINCFEKTTGIKLNYDFILRRPGDLPVIFADVSKARNELDFVANRSIEQMCLDGWNFIQKN